MLSKKEFIDVINFIKEQNNKQLAFIESLENLSPGTYCDAFIFDAYENKLLEVLQNMFDDEEDDIGYFLYEVGFIAENEDVDERKCPTDSEGNILYNSLETLYDYLTREKEKDIPKLSEEE